MILFLALKSDPKAKSQRKPMGEALFVRKSRQALRYLPWPSDLSRLRKELYLDLVVGSVSDPLGDRIDWSMQEVCSRWNWVPGSVFLNNFRFALTWKLSQNALADLEGRPGRNARLSFLRKNGSARLLLQRTISSVLE